MDGKSAPRSRSRKLLATGFVLTAVAVFVSFGVYSTWSATQSTGGSLNAASLSLTSTTTSLTSLLNISNLIPGDVLTRCFAVTNGSSVPINVSISSGFTPTGTSDLFGVNGALISVQQGSGLTATDGTCAGFTGDGVYVLGTNSSGVTGNSLSSTSATQWASNAVKDYQVIVSMPSSVSTAVEGATGTAGITFTGTQLAGGSR